MRPLKGQPFEATFCHAYLGKEGKVFHSATSARIHIQNALRSVRPLKPLVYSCHSSYDSAPLRPHRDEGRHWQASDATHACPPARSSTDQYLSPLDLTQARRATSRTDHGSGTRRRSRDFLKSPRALYLIFTVSVTTYVLMRLFTTASFLFSLYTILVAATNPIQLNPALPRHATQWELTSST